MRLKRFITEQTKKAEGLSKARLKTLIYKETKKFTYNKLYKDSGWKGIQNIWNVFDDIDLDWYVTKAEYRKGNADIGDIMPTSKEWVFEFKWINDKGKLTKGGGYVTAAGSGSVDDPLSKYDVTLVLF